MKKIWILFLSFMFVFGVVSCGGEATLPDLTTDDNTTQEVTTGETTGEMTTETSVVLDFPLNLSVDDTNKTLSWDAVTNASSYNVYVGGVLQTNVTGTSYDFSGLTGDQIIFTVKAVGGSGYLDSDMSSTVAYVANKADEIALMVTALEASPMSFYDTEAFATELVSKGMLADDFNTVLSDVQSFDSNVLNGSVSAIYAAVDALLDGVDIAMIEAFISATIKEELIPMLETSLVYYEERDGQCHYYPYDSTECGEYYDYEDEIQLHNDGIEFLENNSEAVVQSVMVVLQYLLDVESAVDSQLLSQLDSLTTSSFDSTLFVAVKNNVLSLFEDNLPSLEDMILVNSTVMTFIGMLDDSIEMDYEMIVAQSQSELLSLELFFDLLTRMDVDYFDAFDDMMSEETTESISVFVKENIDLLREYLIGNQTTFDELNSLYSVEDMETLFVVSLSEAITTSLMQMLGYDEVDADTLNAQVQSIIEDNLSFENMLLLQDNFEEVFIEVLNNIVENDYALVDSLLAALEAGGRSTSYLAYSDDSFDSNFYIDYYIQEAGTYYVVVEGFGLDYAEYGITVEYGGQILVNDNDMVSEGMRIAYSFTVNPGEEGDFVYAFTTGSSDTVGHLYTEETYIGGSGDSDFELYSTLVGDLLDVFNPIIQAASSEDYELVIDLITSIAAVGLESVDLVVDSDLTVDILLRLLPYVETALLDSSADQLGVVQVLFDEITTTYFDQLMAFYQVSQTTDPMLADLGASIMVANFYLDFTSEAETNIEGLLDTVFDLLREPAVMEELNIDEAYISGLETTVEDLLTSLDTQAQLIQDYDYLNLTTAQEEDVMAFMALFTFGAPGSVE